MIIHAQFTGYLNQLYCAESHLVERLSDICAHPDFDDFQSLINIICENAEARCSKLESIYALINLEYSFVYCKDLINFADTVFDSILKTQENIVERNLALLYYINMINAVTAAAFENIQLLVTVLNDDRLVNLFNSYQSENKTGFHLSVLSDHIRSYQSLVN
ncbi:hypothetical protein D0C36_04590 [Mucilaginibacter conchicola]|uniref:DUF892 family protein n=1 Tax=Mucilaginibacter conchicola TaxID=2303333 RepID=A0A372NZ65_9SPHI|nr:hypothetical protein [Mucilaginibacter conchicola]RFZ94817.1 hypothetical protein D0C36_04590 [Mucilaginibacter conchicola]